MNEIKCPNDLNQFISGESLLKNTFPDTECEEKKFYGDCFHCFVTAICKRDKQVTNLVLDEIRAEIEQNAYLIVHGVNNHEKGMTLYGILQIIDKYRA